MGRRRVGFNTKSRKGGVDSLINATGDEDGLDEEIEDDLEAMLDDEIDKYNSVKDDALKNKSKAKAPRKRKSGPGDLHSDDEEEEVYPLDLDETDEEDDEDKRIALSGSEVEELSGGDDDDDDLETSEDEDEDILGTKDPESHLPDSRAWGRRAKVYHNTDYVDQDFGGFEGTDAEQAELEELEAKEIQQRLTAELDEDDFLDFLPPQQESSKSDKRGDKEILKVDFDNMSDADKKKFIQRECPELLHLLEEYKDKLQEALETKKLMENESDAVMPVIKEYYSTKYHTILNYCINISFFLYLRATDPHMCKGHPVIKRILQFRRLLEELQGFNVNAVKLSNPSSVSEPEEKKLKSKSKKGQVPIAKSKPQKTIQVPAAKSFEDISKLKTNDDEPEAEENESEQEDELEKRGITYEMAKNKGLTPARSKLQRNPRVKHRVKFRKATIRRKGQVRTARHEIKKYDGEAFGIKAHLTKSIKLK